MTKADILAAMKTGAATIRLDPTPELRAQMAQSRATSQRLMRQSRRGPLVFLGQENGTVIVKESDPKGLPST